MDNNRAIDLIITRLIFMRDETETSTSELLQYLYGEHRTDYDAAQIDRCVRERAVKENIRLENKPGFDPADTPSCEIPFIIHNSGAGVKCPRCGSLFVKILLYGLLAPPRTELESKLSLSPDKYMEDGCFVTDHDPKYMCWNCSLRFGFPSKGDGWQTGNQFDYADSIISIDFYRTGCGNESDQLRLTRTADGAKAEIWHCAAGNSGVEDFNFDVSCADWEALIDNLYGKAFLESWPERCVNTEASDGEQWRILVRRPDKNDLYYGCNARPAYWEEFKAAVRPFFSRCGKTI